MIKNTKLDNGVRIVSQKMDIFRSISFGIFIKNGSINEDKKTNGISHFIEHMFFKGTKDKTAKQIAESMDNIGASINAFTSKEYTCYYVKAIDTHIDTAIDTLTDMFFNSIFNEDEIKKESGVILEEIKMYEDSPEDVAFSSIQKEIWKGSPLGMSILGTPENVSSFKRDDFLSYMNEKYVGENIVVALAGNFDENKMEKKLTDIFSKIKKGEKSTCANSKIVYNKSTIKTYKDIEQVHLCLAFPGVSLNSKYNYTISLINTIFGGGMSSILFQKIREEASCAYSIYSYNSNYIANGLFSIYAGLNKDKTIYTTDTIKKEIELLNKDKINIDRINKAKEQIKSSYIMGMESSFNIMSSLGRSMVLLDKIKTQDEVINIINNISKDDVDNCISEVFNIDNMSISIVGKVNDIII